MAGDPISWQTPEEQKRELEKFLQGLQTLWRQSRPLQKKTKPRKDRRSRVDPLEAHADLIPQWLEAEADVGRKQLLERLIALDQERYRPQHKRTLQRRVRNWRITRVQECLENAAQRQETKPETGEKVLPGVNKTGNNSLMQSATPQPDCRRTARSSFDQPNAYSNWTHISFVDDGGLRSCRSEIFPGCHRLSVVVDVVLLDVLGEISQLLQPVAIRTNFSNSKVVQDSNTRLLNHWFLNNQTVMVR